MVSAEVDPRHRDRLRRWLVTVRVDDVLHGVLPPGTEAITILVHSPSRDFADADAVGNCYTIIFFEPVEQPYAGRFDVAESR